MTTDDDAGDEADLGAVEDAAELVAALLVGAHDVLRAGRLEAVRRACPSSGPYGRDDGAKIGDEHEHAMMHAGRARPAGCAAAGGSASPHRPRLARARRRSAGRRSVAAAIRRTGSAG